MARWRLSLSNKEKNIKIVSAFSGDVGLLLPAARPVQGVWPGWDLLMQPLKAGCVIIDMTRRK